MSKSFRDTAPDGGHVVDQLSAYIDNSLDEAKRDMVRAHLETCADCRADYMELLATQQTLRNLPTVPPPRAFTLTEAMVGAAAPRAGFWQRLLAPRNTTRLATGSVLSLLLLLLIALGDMGVMSAGDMTGPRAYMDSAPSSTNESAKSTSRQMSGTTVAAQQALPGAVTSGDTGLPPAGATPMAEAMPTAAAEAPVIAVAPNASEPAATPRTVHAGTPSRSMKLAPVPTPATGAYKGISGIITGGLTTTSDTDSYSYFQDQAQSPSNIQATPSAAVTQYSANQNNNRWVLTGVELALLALGLVMAIAAIVAAQRRT